MTYVFLVSPRNLTRAAPMCNRCSAPRGFFAQAERSAAADGGAPPRPHKPILAEWRRPHTLFPDQSLKL